MRPYKRPAGQLQPAFRREASVVPPTRALDLTMPRRVLEDFSVPKPKECPPLPTNLASQADVDAWNAEHPSCTLPAYATLCDVDARPTERDAILAWNATHTNCAPIPVPEQPAAPPPSSSSSSAGPWLLGGAVLVAAAIAFSK